MPEETTVLLASNLFPLNVFKIRDEIKVIVLLFIIWLAPRVGKMNQIVRCDWLPKRHLARSGLPAVSRMKNFPASHLINPLLTKFVRSRWLDIGLVLFLRVYGPRLRLGPQTRKKELGQYIKMLYCRFNKLSIGPGIVPNDPALVSLLSSVVKYISY